MRLKRILLEFNTNQVRVITSLISVNNGTYVLRLLLIFKDLFSQSKLVLCNPIFIAFVLNFFQGDTIYQFNTPSSLIKMHNFLLRKVITLEKYPLSIYFIFNMLALIATTIVLTVIKTAPAAGLNKMPCLYKTPAAKGKAITLYPVAHIRF